MSITTSNVLETMNPVDTGIDQVGAYAKKGAERLGGRLRKKSLPLLFFCGAVGATQQGQAQCGCVGVYVGGSLEKITMGVDANTADNDVNGDLRRVEVGFKPGAVGISASHAQAPGPLQQDGVVRFDEYKESTLSLDIGTTNESVFHVQVSPLVGQAKANVTNALTGYTGKNKEIFYGGRVEAGFNINFDVAVLQFFGKYGYRQFEGDGFDGNKGGNNKDSSNKIGFGVKVVF